MSSLADLTPSPSPNGEESDYRVCYVLVYILSCVSVYAPTGFPVRSGRAIVNGSYHSFMTLIGLLSVALLYLEDRSTRYIVFFLFKGSYDRVHWQLTFRV